jgi:hypothetical protein
MKHLILYTLILFCFTNLLVAGGWNQKKYQLYTRYSFRYLSSDRYYDATGNKIKQATISDFSNSLYLEYGLFDELTLVGYIPFFRGTVSNNQVDEDGIVLVNGAKHFGFGDLDFGIRYGLIQDGSTVLATTFKLGFPTGANNHALLLLGDGEADYSFGLELGHSFYPTAMYGTAALSYKKRSNGFSNEIFANLELGYNINSDLLFAIKVNSNFLLSAINPSSDWKNIFSQSEYKAYSLELSQKVYENLVLFISLDSAFKAKNALAAPVYSIGFAL